MNDSDTENHQLNNSFKTYSAKKKKTKPDPYDIFRQSLPKKKLTKVVKRKKKKKQTKKAAVDLWKKALDNNLELANFVDSFNKELEKATAHELSVITDTSFNTSIEELESI